MAENAMPIEPTGPDIAAFVVRLAAGDESALREAYQQHHASVRAFANRFLNEREAAEDLVHEVFVALPRALRGFRQEAPLRQFLLSMAVNHARHHLRAAQRRRRAQQRLAREPETAAVTPERMAERRQLARSLAAALDELPVPQRAAFVLCELEERPAAEVARIVGTSEGNVRVRLHNARRTLRQLLAAWHPAPKEDRT